MILINRQFVKDIVMSCQAQSLGDLRQSSVLVTVETNSTLTLSSVSLNSQPTRSDITRLKFDSYTESCLLGAVTCYELRQPDKEPTSSTHGERKYNSHLAYSRRGTAFD